jgi:hypothetical protein
MIVVRCDYCQRFHDDQSYQGDHTPLLYPYAALAHLPSGWMIQFDPVKDRCLISCTHCREARGERVHYV